MMEEGKIYFFTATNLNWTHALADDRHKLVVVDSLRFLVKAKQLVVYGFVIMPNHIHLVWSIPEAFKPEVIQHRFMRFTAQSILQDFKRNHNPLLSSLRVDESDRTFQLWERNPLAIEIYSPQVIWQKMDYTHENPCQEKWKLARYPEEYRFSSASFYLLNKSEWDFITHIDEA